MYQKIDKEKHCFKKSSNWCEYKIKYVNYYRM